VITFVDTRSKNLVSGTLAVEGAGLEKGVKGLPLHAFRIPSPPLYETSFLRKGRFSYRSIFEA